jgi:hypothetical protein
MAGILSGVDPLLEEELIREMQMEEAQKGLLSSAMPQAGPQAGPAPILAPQAGPATQGNRRDTIAVPRSSNSLPSLVPQEYKPKSILDRFKIGDGKGDPALLALSAGLLKGAGDPRGNFFSALGEGVSGYNQAINDERAQFDQGEQQRIQGLYQETSLGQGQQRIDQADREYAEGEPMRKLQIEKLKQDLASGDWVHVGNGVMFNKRDGSTNSAAVQDVLAAERAIQDAQPKNFQNVGNIVDKEGTALGEGVYDPRSGTTYIRTAQGLIPAPVGARQVTEGWGSGLTANQFNELELGIRHEEASLTKLKDFAQNVGGLDVGIKRLANDLSANVKTALGAGLNEQELRQQVARGELQALLGALRLDIVGPGVLTEQDAQRIYQALGGNLGMLANPATAEKLISDIVREKQNTYATMVGQYNRDANVRGVPQKQAQDFSFTPKHLTPEQQKALDLSDEDKALFGKYGVPIQ